MQKLLLIIEYLYLMRFSILIGALLVLGLPSGYKFLPSIFVGLCDARGFLSLALIVSACLHLAWTVMAACRLVLVYGPDRYPSLKVRQTSGAAPVRLPTLLLFASMALPNIVLINLESEDISIAHKILAILLGTAMATTIMLLTALLYYSAEPLGGDNAQKVLPSFGFLAHQRGPGRQGRPWTTIAKIIGRLPPDLQLGYLDQGRLRSGHQTSIVAFAVASVTYGAIGIAFSPLIVSEPHQPAAVFFVLLLLVPGLWVLSGASFFLDALRLPLFTSFLLVSLMTGLYRTDHVYQIQRLAAGASITPPTPIQVIHDWERARNKQNAVTTIVATAGGGIQAGAWTARVLTGLQETCGDRFSSSVVLVSSVSGGSEGAMYFLSQYDSRTGDYPQTQAMLASVNYNAERSSLSAVAWGLTYPDFARVIPIVGSLIPEHFDRGWAIENEWISGWKRPPNLSDWTYDTVLGHRPAVIFNATASESGGRAVFASTHLDSNGTVQFSEKFPTWDIPISTAARLSATFPYVSPLARASGDHSAYHIGDGGYYDNSGILSAIDWMMQAETGLRSHQVLFVLIDGTSSPAASGTLWSWQRQLIGPVETLLNVRTSSQTFRDSMERALAISYFESKNIRVIPAPFYFPPQAVPLSWHLTTQQKNSIASAWSQPSTGTLKSKQTLASVLGCPAP